ncbi:alpha/beta hydrolase [Streptomyces avermitilis]|uniref:alpha/beta hydrolase n=1 Tax=Streptomyces avermitilis TaxID=33903 RepID=UPI0033DC4950
MRRLWNLLPVRTAPLNRIHGSGHRAKQGRRAPRVRLLLRRARTAANGRLLELQRDPQPGIAILRGRYWCEDYGRATCFRTCTDAGYAVLSADYRLNFDAARPTRRDDVISAIGWIKDTTAKFDLNPERIFLLGSSASDPIATTVVACSLGANLAVGTNDAPMCLITPRVTSFHPSTPPLDRVPHLTDRELTREDQFSAAQRLRHRRHGPIDTEPGRSAGRTPRARDRLCLPHRGETFTRCRRQSPSYSARRRAP